MIILVAEVAAGVWAWQNRNEFNKMVESSVQHTVKDEYSIVHSRTVAFDAIQQHVGFAKTKAANTLFNQLPIYSLSAVVPRVPWTGGRAD